MIEETDRASRFFWVLEYIDIDRIDPVSRIQSQVSSGSYHKKQGSRYDSNNGDLSLFAMITEQPAADVAHSVAHPAESAAHPAESAAHPAESAESAAHSAEGASHPAESAEGAAHPAEGVAEGASHTPSHTAERGASGEEGSETWRRRCGLARHQSMDSIRSTRASGKFYASPPREGSRGSFGFSNRSRSFHSIRLQGAANGPRNTHHSSHGSFGSYNGNHNSTNGSYNGSHGERAGSGSATHLRELQRWEGEESGLTLEEEGRDAPFDQFSANKEKFGIDAVFNEELYNVPMSAYDVKEEEWQEVLSAAREMEKGLSADDGRERLAGEIGDGEEDAALYSDVGRHGKKKSRDDDDGFVDSAIRRKR